jgi:hypothetical protein
MGGREVALDVEDVVDGGVSRVKFDVGDRQRGAPDRAILSTAWVKSNGPFSHVTPDWARIASTAPLRNTRPAISIPEIRVCAVKGTMVDCVEGAGTSTR